MIQGQTVVAEAGVPDSVGPSIPTPGGVRLQALAGNTGVVAVGGPPNQYMTIDNVSTRFDGPSAATDFRGAILSAGEREHFPVSNLSDLWIDAANNADGVSWLAYT